MVALRVVILILALGAVAAFTWPEHIDLLLLAGPSAAVCLYLLLRFSTLMGKPSRRQKDQKWIVIDGSNILFWKDNTPNIDTVKAVIKHLKAQGYSPGAVFDANIGYKIMDRYVDDAELAVMLGLPPDRTLVVPKGSIADQTVLEAARSLGAKVLTNDRYRDWAEEFPEVEAPGHLIKGGYRDGKLWLDLP